MIASILGGIGRPLEGMEIPATCHWLMFAGFTLIGLWGAVLYRFRREAVAFISVWYVLGALFWFPWVLATANVVVSRPQVTGVMQAIVAAWFAHNVIGWWLTAIGLAAAYFFIPKTINRPIHSYSLASLGFWTFAFLSGLTGMVRLSGGPVPVWLVTVSITASIMMIVPLSTVTANLVLTMRGHTDMVYHSPTIRFTYFGALAFAVAGALGILGSLRSFDSIVHFTQFANAHQSILLYSFYSMVMFGAFYYITPRLVGCEWLSSTMISLHFWGAAYGGAMVAAMLLFSGLAQGLSYADPAETFPQILQIAQVYFPGRTIALLLVSLAHVIFALHFLLMLLRIGQPGGEPTLFAPTGRGEALNHEPFFHTFRRSFRIVRRFVFCDDPPAAITARRPPPAATVHRRGRQIHRSLPGGECAALKRGAPFTQAKGASIAIRNRCVIRRMARISSAAGARAAPWPATIFSKGRLFSAPSASGPISPTPARPIGAMNLKATPKAAPRSATPPGITCISTRRESFILPPISRPYRYLFEKRKISGQGSADALRLTGEDAPNADEEIVPGPDAKSLVKYLLSLDRSHPLKEASAAPPGTPEAPAAPAASAAPAAPAAK